MRRSIVLASILPILLISQVMYASASTNANTAESKLEVMSSMVKNVKTKVDTLVKDRSVASQNSVVSTVQDAKVELNKIKAEFVKLSVSKDEKKHYKQFGKVIKQTDKALNEAFWTAKFTTYNDKNFIDSLNKFSAHYSKVIELSKKARPLL